MRKIAVDTNTLTQLVGIYNFIKKYRAKGYAMEAITTALIMNFGSLKLPNAVSLYNAYSLIAIGKIKLIILPTVFKEATQYKGFNPEYPDYQKYFDDNKSNLSAFIRDYCSNGCVTFNESEKQNIRKLTQRFMDGKAFHPNKNPKNATNDARIMAETMFAGVDYLLTLDNHFFNNEDKINIIAHELNLENDGNIKRFNPSARPVSPGKDLTDLLEKIQGSEF